jgi:hypothetical protein
VRTVTETKLKLGYKKRIMQNVHLIFESLGCGNAASPLNRQLVASRKTPEVNDQNTKLRYVKELIRKGPRSVGE